MPLFARLLHGPIGSLGHHNSLVHPHVKHPFTPETAQNIGFPCVGQPCLIKQVCDLFQKGLLFRLGLRYADADLSHMGVCKPVSQLHRIHALGHAVQHMLPPKDVANNFLAADAVEHGQYDRILPHLVFNSPGRCLQCRGLNGK